MVTTWSSICSIPTYCLFNLWATAQVVNYDYSGISKSVGWQGGGNFIYVELMKWNENYMTDIRDSKTTQELIALYNKMKSEAFFRYEIDLSVFDTNELDKLTVEEQKQVLCACLDKNHLYVNLSEIDDTTYVVTETDKTLNKQFYNMEV